MHPLTIENGKKQLADSYTPGNVIVTDRNGIGSIIAVDTINNTLSVRSNSENHIIDLKKDAEHLQIYSEHVREFIKGDKVVFLRDDAKLGIKAGQTGIFTQGTNTGELKVSLGKKNTITLDRDYKYLDYGHAVDDFKSTQTLSKNILYAVDTQYEINSEKLYTRVINNKQSLQIYTDNKNSVFNSIKSISTESSLKKIDEVFGNLESKHKIYAINNDQILKEAIVDNI